MWGEKSSAAVSIGNLIQFNDDGPAAPVLTPVATAMVIDETLGVDAGTNDVKSTDLPAAVLAKFDAIVTAGDNGVDTNASPLDDHALAFAASSGALVTTSTLNFGVDGPAASGSKSYALVVTDGTPSGVETTGLTAAAGTQIFLYNGTGTEAGLILGRVGHENGVNPDTADANGRRSAEGLARRTLAEQRLHRIRADGSHDDVGVDRRTGQSAGLAADP